LPHRDSAGANPLAPINPAGSLYNENSASKSVCYADVSNNLLKNVHIRDFFIGKDNPYFPDSD
jgi:hypothetical protein